MSSLGTNYSHNDGRDNTHAVLSANHQQAPTNYNSSNHSGVSWGAVLAGTAVAAALSLILIILGVGFGMSSISVWSSQGISAQTLGFTAIVWLTFTQIIAYGMGGYLAGRLRVKWVALHDDEVYFRDTAHGFLTWAIASLLCATLLTSVIGKIAAGAVNANANLVGGTTTLTLGTAAANLNMGNMDNANQSSLSNPLQYMVATLFRKDIVDDANETSADTNVSLSSNTDGSYQASELLNIFVNNMNASVLPPSEVKYAGQLVSQQTGLSQSAAEDRIEMTFKKMQDEKAKAMQVTKETAEKARKTAANTALWFFVLLLVGAFSASLAATWGGKSRDS